MTRASDTRLTCKRCSAVRYMLFDDCLANGWPEHCGETMRIDGRPERHTLEQAVKLLLGQHQLHTAADPDSVAARVEHPATYDSSSEAGATGEAGPQSTERCGSATSSEVGS